MERKYNEMKTMQLQQILAHVFDELSVEYDFTYDEITKRKTYGNTITNGEDKVRLIYDFYYDEDSVGRYYLYVAFNGNEVGRFNTASINTLLVAIGMFIAYLDE